MRIYVCLTFDVRKFKDGKHLWSCWRIGIVLGNYKLQMRIEGDTGRREWKTRMEDESGKPEWKNGREDISLLIREKNIKHHLQILFIR